MKITPYKKKNKTYYKFKIRIGIKVTSRAGFKTKTDAIAEYNNLLQNYELEKSGEITYKDLYNKRLNIYKMKVKESTYNSTTKIFKNHILTVFEKMYIKDITPQDCQNFALSLKDYVKGKEIFNHAKRVITYAIKMNLIQTNPFDNVILPKFQKGKTMINYLEVNEVNKLLDYFKDDQYYYTMFRLFIFSGLRRGELLALKWDDIDFKNKTLNVNKSLSKGEYNKLFVSTTKTENSTRIITVDKDTLLSLKRLKIQSTSDIIFSNRKGNYLRLSTPQDKLNEAIKKTSIKKIRIHDLRHTHASLLFASGANAKEVQERLGHKDIKTTMNIYTHVTKNKQKTVLNNFVKYMNQ